MTRIITSIGVFLLVLISGVATSAQDDSAHAPSKSIIRLIAQPGSNKPEKVQVAGFLVLVFEGEALYLHKEDYIEGLSNNSVRVSLSDEQMKEYKSLFRELCMDRSLVLKAS